MAYLIKGNRRPPVLYKYRDISERTKNLLSNRELYFPSIAEINDPFDCRIILNRNASPKKLWRWVLKKLECQYGTNDPIELVYKWFRNPNVAGASFTKEMAVDFINKKLWKKLDPNNPLSYFKILTAREANIRMFCLSATNDNILMWSHYALKHHGICLGFDISSNPVFKKTAQVKYAKRYPRADYYRVNDEQYYEYSLLTKSDSWKYEKEWRLVLTKTEGLRNPVHHFEPSFLRELIFGCQTSTSERAKIIQWLLNGGLDPDLYQAILSEKEYRLEIAPIRKP
jgi:hypothetical protein